MPKPAPINEANAHIGAFGYRARHRKIENELMKQCPTCKNTYTDDSLQFCLSDGTPLVSMSNDAPPTVRMVYEKQEPMRVSIPADSAPTVFAPPPVVNNPPAERKGYGLVIAGVAGLTLLLIGGGLAAFFLIPRLKDDKNSVAATNSSPAATVAPTATANNDETAKLKEEMANLKKQLENQKNRKSISNASTPPSSDDNGKTAYANSPGDGFLALRSEPSSETGARLAKIPHGAALTVVACPKSSNVGKMPGRWCRVNYNGQSGWAFDAFLSF